MRYVSLFSGIEAASVAWEPLGWEPVAFAEIEPFPCAVLEYRFPNVPNLGDVTKIDWSGFIERYGAVDIVCGGSPCQSFSIAGGRESLDGESRLMFEYIRAVRELRPRWFVWENVPGVLNTRDDAFGCLLDQMDESGYSTAWRVLDAQFFGVAQRRRRVWAVGASRDAFGDLAAGRAAAVLFERESVRGNTQSSKQKRQELTRAAEGRAGGSYTLKLRHTGSDLTAGAGGVGPLVQNDVSATLATSQDQTLFCLQGDIARGAHLGQNGIGYQRDMTYTLNTIDTPAVTYALNRQIIPEHSTAQGPVESLELTPCLDTNGPHVICMATGQANAETMRGMSPTLNAAHEQPIVITAHQNASGDVHIASEMTGTIVASASVSRQQIICVGSDSSKPAVDFDMASTLHVGGGAP